MKVKEVIDLINEQSTIYSIFAADDEIEGKVVSANQDLSQHRWYSIATRVYQVEDGFVAVRGPFQLFSEAMSWKDLDIKCSAFEVVPQPSTYYKAK